MHAVFEGEKRMDDMSKFHGEILLVKVMFPAGKGV
jgi:hypothetical protein